MTKTLVLQPTPNIGATASLVHALEAKGLDVNEWISTQLDRHFTGDWGNLDEFDKCCNRAALADGSRILSRYDENELSVYVITDAADSQGVRHTTTIMQCSDY